VKVHDYLLSNGGRKTKTGRERSSPPDTDSAGSAACAFRTTSMSLPTLSWVGVNKWTHDVTRDWYTKALA
jgi:hypothetical protein